MTRNNVSASRLLIIAFLSLALCASIRNILLHGNVVQLHQIDATSDEGATILEFDNMESSSSSSQQHLGKDQTIGAPPPSKPHTRLKSDQHLYTGLSEEYDNATKNDIEQLAATAFDPSPSLLKKSRPGRQHLACEIEGPIDKQTYQVLQKIRRGIISNQDKLKAMNTNTNMSMSMNMNNSTRPRPRPRILCLVYTHEGAHSTNVQALVDTWATQCDGFIAASNATNASIGAMNLKHQGPEAYANMWQKIKSMWKHTHDHHLHEYDYFHICGDDTYVIVDNLRLYLMGDQVDKLLNGFIDNVSKQQYHENSKRWETERPRPLILGYPKAYRARKVFAAGGSGYTLNRAAVKMLVNHTSHGPPDNTTDSREDFFVSRILSSFGVHTSDTRDVDGAFRYVPNNPVSEWKGIHQLYSNFRIELHKGIRVFSNETVAMHLNYRNAAGMGYEEEYNITEIIYRYHDFLIGRCDEQLLSWQATEETEY